MFDAHFVFVLGSYSLVHTPQQPWFGGLIVYLFVMNEKIARPAKNKTSLQGSLIIAQLDTRIVYHVQGSVNLTAILAFVSPF